MIHIYCGDGKGKTTAAMGLALRAAGHGRRVVIAQFLKNGKSGERTALSALPAVELLPASEVVKFTFQMTEEERRREAERQSELLEAAFRAAEGAGLLVLDELIASYNLNMVNREEVLEFLKTRPGRLEVVMTGRDPAEELLELADYVSKIVKIKHPFDRGIPARTGIEM